MKSLQRIDRPTPKPTPVPWRGLPLALACGAALVLAACGGGGGGDSSGGNGGAGTSYTVGVTVTSAVGAGETFTFALQGQSLTVSQSGVSVKFGQGLASGTAYTVNETAGPRTCTLSSNRTGTLTANVEVTANCGAAAGSSALSGVLVGPIGAQVTLQNNAADDLALTVPPFTSGAAAYNEQAFAFATPLFDGSVYSATVKTPPVGQLCSVYAGGSGTMPVAVGTVKVGCEWKHDLVSRSTDSTAKGTFYDSGAPSIGGADAAIGATVDGYGEGRFVAFVSSAAGLAGNTNAHRQIFWRDRYTGETQLVSASAGVEGNGDSAAPQVSADGLTVVFESNASNLVAGDTNAVSDVFMWNATTPTIVTRVSVGPAGVQANAASSQASVSGDGAVVAFSSGASNLTPGVSGINTINVYRRNLATSSNTLVSASASNGAGVGGALPVLSEDGTRLAFYSFSSAIVTDDTNGLWDIFVYDSGSGATTRVSLTNGGGERNGGTESASRVVAPAISGNGRYVAFATTASNMVSGDTNATQDVFVVDTQTGAALRASIGTGGVQGNADSPTGQGERVSLSYDGTWVAFSTSATNLGAGSGNVLMHNNVTGQTLAVSSGGSFGVGAPSLSRSGYYAAYGSGTALDTRYTSTGIFSTYTGVGKAFFWN